ncbi:MAG: YjgN family protein [Firmicutes bacterium]|nr:YjgN family protein [Bacillota bacterium]
MEENEKSKFDGGLIGFIGIIIATVVLSALIITIPLAVCVYHNWITKHTVIEGRRLAFDGKAGQLFGNWIKWILLGIITLGIYHLVVPFKMRKWVTKHTHFEEVA